MGYDVHITRRMNWADEGDDITVKEWLDIVVVDPELSLYSQNGPYFAIWKSEQSETEYWMNWSNGNINSKNPDEPLVNKMILIARFLGASVQGDDGEIYGDDNWNYEESKIVRQTADRLVDILKAGYGDANHSFAKVNPSDFRRDMGFYDRTTGMLKKAGFTHLGDVEDRNVSSSNPSMRTFIRIMLSSDKTTTAGIYDATPSFFIRIMAWFLGMRNFKCIDLESESLDGTFLITTTSPASPLQQPPQIIKHSHSPKTPIPELLRLHQQLVIDYFSARNESPRIMETLDEILESQQRQITITHEFRKSMGFGFMASEKEGFSEGLDKKFAGKVFDEVDKKTGKE